MAPRFWVGTDGSWNTPDNWSAISGGIGGAGVPGVDDDVTFDGAGPGNTNCTCDAPMNIASLTVESGYTATFDFSDNGYSHNIAGDATFAGGGTVDLGDGNNTFGGDLSWNSQSTFTRGSAINNITGTGVTLNGHVSKRIGTLVITGSATIGTSTVTTIYCQGDCDIQGSLDCVRGMRVYLGTVNCSGTVTGAGPFIIELSTFQTMTGTWDPVDTYLYYGGTFNATGTFNGDFWFTGLGQSRTLNFGSGARVFTGNCRFADDTSNLTVNNTNNGDLTFQGDVTLDATGGLTWNRGSGTIAFSGSNAQTLTIGTIFTSELEAISVNKTAGVISLAGDMTCVSFSGVASGSGSFAPGSNTITTTSNCDWASGFTLGAMTGSTWVVGGNWTADGQTLTAAASWALQVTGSAVASGTGAVAYSDATGFTQVQALLWTDNGNNQNWLFAPPTPALAYWVGTSTSWNDGSNWSASSGGAGGAGVPGDITDVIFDGGSVQDCTLDIPMDIVSLDVQVGYTGTLDFSASSFSHAISGDVTLAGGGTVDLGNGTNTIGGNFAWSTQSTLTGTNAATVMTGDGVSLTGASTKRIGPLTIVSNATIATETVITVYVQGDCDIQGSVNCLKGLRVYLGTLTCSGTVSGAGPVVLESSTFQTMSGTWQPDETECFYNCTWNATGTFGGSALFTPVGVNARVMTFGTGSRTFTGPVIFNDSGVTYTVDNTAGGSFEFRGDVNWNSTSSLTWNKGAGAITFGGSTAQTITPDPLFTSELEDITVSKPDGVLSLAGNLSCESFTGSNTGLGSMDPGGNTVTTSGNCDWFALFTLGSLDGSTWVVGGNWTSAGQTLSATAPWFLQVTGTAVASGTGSVAYSDASGFTQVDATAWGPAGDAGNNVNWDFGVVAPEDVTGENAFGSSGVSFTWTVSP